MNPLVRAYHAVRKSLGFGSALSPAGVDRGTWMRIFDSFPGAWQADLVLSKDNVLAFSAVYRCISLIANDVAKLRLKLMEKQGRVWVEVESPAFSPVLRKPNTYQNRAQFFASWLICKLIAGNTYALKRYDARGVVNGLYILDPNRVQPMVSDSGLVFYQLQTDNISGIEEQVLASAEEIIHDRMNTLFHPLVGIGPLYACGLSATQGLKIQGNSSKFFGNMSRPSGILTAPGTIADATANRLKDKWDENYKGDNFGKVAVLGDGLKYESMSVSPEAAQMIEQLKWTAEDVCLAFGVPPFKVGIGAMPAYGSVEALNQIYYGDVLQGLIESLELCLDEGLALNDVPGRTLGTEFEVDDLMRMDTATRFRTWGEGIKAGMLAPNEARAREDLPPVTGGDSCYLQQQEFSLEALAKRDAKADPFAVGGSGGTGAPPADPMAPKGMRELVEQVARPMIEAALTQQVKALPEPEELEEGADIRIAESVAAALQAA